MGEQEQNNVETKAEMLAARRQSLEQAIKIGLEEGIKSWLHFRDDITVDSQTSYVVSEVVKTFKINDDLAEKIVIGFFNECLTSRGKQHHLEAGVDLLSAREQGRELGIYQAIKTWMNTTRDITPSTRRSYVVGDVVRTFEIDKALATKIVNDVFDEVLEINRKMEIARIEYEHFCAEVEAVKMQAEEEARQRAVERGFEEGIKTWLSNRKDITPNTERAPLISEVIETFKLDEDLATKIVNNFFNERFNN